MKTSKIVSVVLVLTIGLFLSSCNTSEELTGDSFNYWQSNALTRMILHGSVHTMTEHNSTSQTVSTFNTDGNLTSTVHTDTSSTTTMTYSYENGKLLSKTEAYLSNSSSSTFTTTYEYGNVGKYVPLRLYHVCEVGLVPSLSAVIEGDSRTDYVFNGTDELSVVDSYLGTPYNTTIIHYSGNYPSSYTLYNGNISMSFAENGMFNSYTENYPSIQMEESRVSTFLQDDAFQLLEKEVTTIRYMSDTSTINSVSTITINYTYNDHKYLTEVRSNEGITQWFDYDYDSAGNWTVRNSRYFNSLVPWVDNPTETRCFTYY